MSPDLAVAIGSPSLLPASASLGMPVSLAG